MKNPCSQSACDGCGDLDRLHYRHSGRRNGQGIVVREQKRIALTGMPNVTIRTFDGSIQLRPWDRNEILLDIERRAATTAEAKSLEVNVTESGGNVLIEAKRPTAFRRLDSPGGPDVARCATDADGAATAESRGAAAAMGRSLCATRRARIEVRTGDGASATAAGRRRGQVSTGDGGDLGARSSGEHCQSAPATVQWR